MDIAADEKPIPAMIGEAQRLTRLSIAIAAHRAHERAQREAAERRRKRLVAAHESHPAQPSAEFSR